MSIWWQIGGGGSHNIVVGRYNQFTSAGFGNLVVREGNTAQYGAEFVAGEGNTVTGFYGSILGGYENIANGSGAVICGGQGNWATGEGSVELGGYGNKENAAFSITLGGYNMSDSLEGEYFINLY
jgi:hypothetical protein